jgi:hypothetical protein
MWLEAARSWVVVCRALCTRPLRSADPDRETNPQAAGHIPRLSAARVMPLRDAKALTTA